MNNLTMKTSTKRIIALIAAFVLVFAFTSSVFAAGDEIEDKVTEGADRIYSTIRSLDLVVGGCLIAWYAFKGFFGGTKGMDDVRKNIFNVIAICALIYLAPTIIKFVGSLFSSDKSLSTLVK